MALPVVAAFRVPARAVLVIGRADSADIQIDDPSVARRHARLRYVHGRLNLEALDPVHPVYVNGLPIGRRLLALGDIVTIGEHNLEVIQTDVLRWTKTLVIAHRLSLRNVTLLRHDRHVFQRDRVTQFGHGLDVDLESGRLTVLIGPSGEGKTTLCEGILGEVTQSTGLIQLDGVAVRSRQRDLHDRISFVPQEPAMHKELPLRQALTYVAALRLPPDWTATERAARVEAILVKLGLAESADAGVSVGNLSGGQKKRASLAMELLTEPEVLLLDEPTSGLDEGLDFELMEQLRELAAEDRIVVVVTHSLRNIRPEDHVVALGRGGRVAYRGPATGLPEAMSASNGAELMERLRSGVTGPQTNLPDAPILQAGQGGGAANGVPGRPRQSRTHPGPLRQLLTLTSREFARRRAHPVSFWAALLLFPILTALTARVMGDVPLGNVHWRESRTVILNLGTCLAFFAMSFSFTSIVSDWDVVRRESRWGIRSGLFVLARFIRGAVFATWMALASMVLYLQLAEGPEQPLIDRYLSFCVIAFAEAVCVVALGLLISAIAPRLEPVVYWMVVVFAAAIILSGVTLPFDADFGAILQPLSLGVPTRWASAAWGIEMRLAQTWDDPMWKTDSATLWTNVTFLGVLTVIYLAIAISLVHRRLRRPA
jgi:ABC-type multidrug transport system ATPase subunit